MSQLSNRSAKSLGLLIALTLLTVPAIAIQGAEQISPVADLPILQHTFQFMATTEDEETDAVFLLTRSRLDHGKETLLPPMLGSGKVVRGRNLLTITLLPGKNETLFQFSLNGNGGGYRLIDKYESDEVARAATSRRYTFLPKPAWSKEHRGLILTEGPDKDPERIRCVLEIYHPDPNNDGIPGRAFGPITTGADNF